MDEPGPNQPSQGGAVPFSTSWAREMLQELIAHDQELMKVLNDDLEFKQRKLDEIREQSSLESAAAEKARERLQEAQHLYNLSVENHNRFLSPPSKDPSRTLQQPLAERISKDTTSPLSESTQAYIRSSEKLMEDSKNQLQQSTDQKAERRANAMLAKMLIVCLENAIKISEGRVMNLQGSILEYSNLVDRLKLFHSNLLTAEVVPSSILAVQRINKDIWTNIFSILVSREEQFPGPSRSQNFLFPGDRPCQDKDLEEWDTNRYSLRLSMVCHHWRQILHSTPSLWATLSLAWEEDQKEDLKVEEDYIRHHISLSGVSDLALVVLNEDFFQPSDIDRIFSIIPSLEVVKTFIFRPKYDNDTIYPWIERLTQLENVIGYSNHDMALNSASQSIPVRYIEVPNIWSYEGVVAFPRLERLVTSLESFHALGDNPSHMPSLRQLHIAFISNCNSTSADVKSRWNTFWEHNANGDTVDELILTPANEKYARLILPFVQTFTKVTKLELRGAHSIHVLSALLEKENSSSEEPRCFPRLNRLTLRDCKASNALLGSLVTSRRRLFDEDQITAYFEEVYLQDEPGIPERLFVVDGDPPEANNDSSG